MPIHSIGGFLEWNPPPVESYLGNKLITHKAKVMLYGYYEAMKSMLVLSMAKSLSEGKDWLGMKVHRPIRVLLYQTELAHAELWTRTNPMWHGRLNGSAPDSLYLWTADSVPLLLDTAKGMDMFLEGVDVIKPELVIIDPLYTVVSRNISDPVVARELQAQFDRLQSTYGAAVLVVHHARKLPSNPELLRRADLPAENSDDAYGSVFLSTWPDTTIRARRIRDGGEVTDDVRIEFPKTRMTPLADRPRPFVVSFDSGEFNFLVREFIPTFKEGSRQE